MSDWAAALLVAGRELRLLRRSRAMLGAALILAAVAWLPAFLLSLRTGRLGLAPLAETLPLALSLAAVVLPLLALLAGAELLAGEVEDRSLVPVVTLPVSRRACLAGKSLGRAAALAAVYLAAFASLGGAMVALRGLESWSDWLALTAGGLLMSLACGGIGAALAAAGGGRVRAFATALVVWVGLVFALDALLLAVVVALAPAPPTSVGRHGHSELTAPVSHEQTVDPHAREASPQAPAPAAISTLVMAASPVSLFRLTTLQTSSALRPRLSLALPRGSPATRWAIVVVGWIGWLTLPLFVARRRFLSADL